MLTRHEKTSRTRLMAGAGATMALLVTTLGLTASGTQAAERVRAKVEDAVGVDLASLELPAIPALPAAPQAEPPAPPAPPAPPEMKRHTRIIMTDKDGKVSTFSSDDADVETLTVRREPGETRRRIFVRPGNGKPFTWEGTGPISPEVAARLRDMRIELKDMPEITSRTCKDGEGRDGEHVINRKDGDKRITIICTNRIERLASLAGAQTLVMKSHAEASALAGLRSARRGVENNSDMSDSQRASALAGIDQAIRELEAAKKD